MRATDHLRQLLENALSGLGLAWPAKTTIEPPRDAAHGDLATNVAMVAAKQARKPPRELAESLRQILAADPRLSEVSVAGPGFLNITFAPAFWQETVLDVTREGAAYGSLAIGAGTKIQVEFVSANPTGPLHIGHGRGAAVGDSLARVLRAAGFTVETEYYINDAGRQMRILGQSILYRYRELLGEPVTEPEDYYRGDYVKDLAQELIDSQGRALLDMDFGILGRRKGKQGIAKLRIYHEIGQRQVIGVGIKILDKNPGDQIRRQIHPDFGHDQPRFRFAGSQQEHSLSWASFFRLAGGNNKILRQVGLARQKS